jgi:hypothetical protein
MNQSDLKLLFEKITADCKLLVESNNQPFLPGVRRQDLVHDLVPMAWFQDLASISCELLREAQVVAAAVWKFTGKTLAIAPRGFDRGGGLELPVLQGQKLTPKFTIQRKGNDVAYRHQLRLNWTDTENTTRQKGSSFGSQHVLKTTGGRAAAEFFVADDARRELSVYKAGAREFAFAKSIDGKLRDIYLHASFAPEGFRFHRGQRLWAVVVTTPAGLQAREIKPV